MASSRSYVSSYEQSPIVRRSALASPRYGASAPTLDQARFDRAQRQQSALSSPLGSSFAASTPIRSTSSSSAAAAATVSPGLSAIGNSSSAAIGEGIPPPTQTSRTAQLNMSMLENKVHKLEEAQMRIAGEVRAELQGMFSDRIKTLETTVSEAVEKHAAELTRQQTHFSSLCGRLQGCCHG
eukprot:COSAG06_NODE_23057_length_704_cov_0.611570_1_plen_182_part_00